MGSLIWLAAALVLAIGETMVGDLTLLMLAGAAAVGAAVSWAGAPLWLSVLAFALGAFALLVFLRPVVRKKMATELALDTSQRALLGASAEVLEDVGRTGQVRLDGTIWSARSLDPSHVFTAGEHVTVVRFDGPVAIIWKEVG